MKAGQERVVNGGNKVCILDLEKSPRCDDQVKERSVHRQWLNK